MQSSSLLKRNSLKLRTAPSVLREKAKEIVDKEASAARPGVSAAAQYVIPPPSALEIL